MNRRGTDMWSVLRQLGLGLALLVTAMQPATTAEGAGAKAVNTGAVSGLPVPRFVSLKSDEVNVRRGPDKTYAVSWVFQRAGLPVEVTAEYENWRQIRDSDGAEGWVFHSMLSGRRTALVAPWSEEAEFPLRAAPDGAAAISARLQRGVLADVRRCDGAWCELRGSGFSGYLEQDKLWGVYPGEQFD